MTEFKGSCLCGGVRYQGSAPQFAGHCYCVDCRKTSGTAHGSHMAVAEENFHFDGELRFFEHPADSGNDVSRAFCPVCGSAVLSRNSGMPGLVFVRASSLDTPDVFQPMMSVYTSRAPNWANIDDSLPAFAEMPPVE